MGKFPYEEIKREILVKRESETDSSMGCRPEERKTEEIINYGIVNIDKPRGPTSHQVSDFLQKILCIKKAGHSGSLDPAVTGMLPVALGRGTRIVQSLLKAGKEYVGIMHLHKAVDEKEIRKAVDEFKGKIRQLPPIKSAVKRVERERMVYYFDILEIDGQDVLFRIGAEAGTYIRKVCHDLGLKLGVGAHMAELRRTRVGPFDEKTKTTLQELTDAFWYYKNRGDESLIRKFILPVETGIEHLGKVWITDTTVEALSHGVDLMVPGIAKLESKIKKDDIVAVLTLKGEIVATGTAKMDSEQMLKEKKGLAVDVNKVFMLPGVYKIA